MRTELWNLFQTIALIPNSILNTFLSGRVRPILYGILDFAKQHLSLSRKIAYKKNVYDEKCIRKISISKAIGIARPIEKVENDGIDQEAL